jgi:lysophospholipase L1-like esterase
LNLVRRLAAVFSLALLASPAFAQNHWVASWGASPMKVLATTKPMDTTIPVTFRNIVHLSLGGSQMRLTLSNQYGTEPLSIGSVTIARSTGAGAIDATSLQPVLFAGKAATLLAPGTILMSDPVNITAAPLSDLAVSIFLPAQTITSYTEHAASRQTNYFAKGDQSSAATMSGAKDFTPWRFLTAIDVMAPAADATIVAFGDSITDGANSKPDANHRWPNLLANRLQADPKYAHLSVVDEGIGGNRILHSGTGPSALDRWDYDALARAGVKYIILLESINDIGHSSLASMSDSKLNPEDIITADQLIAAMNTLIEQAHAKGIKVIGATITPFEGAGYAHPDGEKIVATVNDFIRNGSKFDGVVDFNKAVADPQKPLAIAPAYNNTDHLHPNDAGYQAMADSIDLSLFQ